MLCGRKDIIDLNAIEAAARAAINPIMTGEYHIVTASPATALEMVSMIRKRDAVLRQALYGLQTCYPSDARDEAIEAIKEVLEQ